MSQHVPTALPPKIDDLSLAIITTQWNAHITDALASGAVARLKELGYDPSETLMRFEVPGAIELTFAASQLIETSRFDAIIVIGCVIKGDTPHFDYVCQSVTQGITALNADVDTPVIFGVLTVNNEDQAKERLNKGAEFVDTAIKMVGFRRAAADL